MTKKRTGRGSVRCFHFIMNHSSENFILGIDNFKMVMYNVVQRLTIKSQPPKRKLYK